MGFANFDKAGLAVIAYAIVNADGTFRGSSNVTLLPHGAGTGNYTFIAPYDLQGVQIPLFSADDLSIATLMDDGSGGNSMIRVSNLGPYAKAVIVGEVAGPPVDRAFSLLILRQLTQQP